MNQAQGKNSQPVSGPDLCAYVAGEVTAEEKRRIESALAGSGELRRELRELEATWRILERYAAPEPPSEGLADLHRRLKTVRLPVYRSWCAQRYALPGVAASFILVIGVFLTVMHQSFTPNTAPFVAGKAHNELAAVRPAVSTTMLSTESPQRFFFSGDGFLRAEEAVVPDSVDEGIAKVGPEHWTGRRRTQEYPINNFAYRGQETVASPARVKAVVFGPM
jgi:hypothetical protein